MKHAFLLLLLLCASMAFSQTPSTRVPLASAQSPLAAPAAGVTNTEKERDLYKLMYENSANANEKLLTLTQWTLGVSLAIVLGIIASQVFFNYRINRQELDAISNGIQGQIDRLQLEIAQKFTEEVSKANSSLESSKTELTRSVNALIEAQFTVNEKALERELRNQKGELMLEIRQLRRLAKKNEGDIWNLKNVKSNALSCFIEVAELETGLLMDEKYTLKEIVQLLTELDEVMHTTHDKLEALLPKIRASNISLKNKMVEILKTKPTYNFVRPDRQDHFLFNMPQKQYVRNKPK
ncbi:hypothetical protein [Hymenobacter siberiensis]|uniref:hypothetical protein n=1 Tax=Hymenobacter siberiensis TaxID=2848396 RepID=UPI001C1E5A90|nr:hypothetical protein [Hymenobacter siberiensis]MBU6122594.1 hypothetical protein [Hymenobacter siberiensis]